MKSTLYPTLDIQIKAVTIQENQIITFTITDGNKTISVNEHKDGKIHIIDSDWNVLYDGNDKHEAGIFVATYFDLSPVDTRGLLP